MKAKEEIKEDYTRGAESFWHNPLPKSHQISRYKKNLFWIPFFLRPRAFHHTSYIIFMHSSNIYAGNKFTWFHAEFPILKLSKGERCCLEESKKVI